MTNVQTAKSADTGRASFFGLFLALLRLCVHNGGIFFVQIQLDIQSIEPFRLFFQFRFIGERLGKFSFGVLDLLQCFRLFCLGGVQSGREFGNLIFYSGQVSQSVRAYLL